MSRELVYIILQWRLVNFYTFDTGANTHKE